MKALVSPSVLRGLHGFHSEQTAKCASWINKRSSLTLNAPRSGSFGFTRFPNRSYLNLDRSSVSPKLSTSFPIGY
ncbi:hypothetical protein M0804_011209 [Polistes exclamans]|nr:hypothetical protein M0804_011209 [Polistes exclamans]